MIDESEKHFVHRLESFSDIVIGFSLAQLGVSLVIPHNGASLLANPGWFFGFAFAFAVVCGLWYTHHRLFAHYFIPKTLPVILNFVWLGVVILLVYATVLEVHLTDDWIVTGMYFGAYALAQGILAVQYLLSIHYGASPLARRSAAYVILWTMPFVVSFVATLILQGQPLLGAIIYGSFIAAAIGTPVLRSRFRKLEARQAISASGP